jgi:phosphodiesterase/alkaline phosphatase D-like protein
VSLLGGGGFFAIGISARGVTEIEAALEFGAGVAIDLGVASGSVEIKAGVYFHWLEPEPDRGPSSSQATCGCTAS